MVKVQESPPSIKVTRKSIVCESLSKGLVVQGKDTSPLVQPTQGKLYCYLIVFLCQISIRWSFSKV
jgi:hypothetical protein